MKYILFAHLQVLRPSGDDEMAYFLTGQVTYDVPSEGEHVIDIKDRPLKVTVV